MVLPLVCCCWCVVVGVCVCDQYPENWPNRPKSVKSLGNWLRLVKLVGCVFTWHGVGDVQALTDRGGVASLAAFIACGWCVWQVVCLALFFVLSSFSLIWWRFVFWAGVRWVASLPMRQRGRPGASAVVVRVTRWARLRGSGGSISFVEAVFRIVWLISPSFASALCAVGAFQKFQECEITYRLFLVVFVTLLHSQQ
ncbi:unnamed protein product [Amoebophrya sp. A25]|nr:unnamed protein product [Amoebophrya sp. A25]|eukprot:GSA25T00001065001.1